MGLSRSMVSAYCGMESARSSRVDALVGAMALTAIYERRVQRSRFIRVVIELMRRRLPIRMPKRLYP